MRCLSADIIFPISKPPIKNGVLIIDDNRKIIDVLDPLIDEISDSIPLEKFKGILCPGFVNAHCHLELSHLKGLFAQKKGLPYFIGEMVEKRNAEKEKIVEAMSKADTEMYEGGIVAVGDIINSSVSLDIKKSGRVYYHTFVELFDIFPDRAESVFENGILLEEEFNSAGLKTSIVPHAPYTVTEPLMKLIFEKAGKSKSILCIHNQESKSENEMFEKGSGPLIDKLQQLTGAFAGWRHTGKTSLESICEKFSPNQPLQLVHNTFTGSEDIKRLFKNTPLNLYWCLCVNANLFIENTLPDVGLMVDEKCLFTVGTDSYASNTSLSILDELKTINRNFPRISLADTLRWATLNGAAFLERADTFGSFDNGKIPGINLITNIDFQGISLQENSIIKRID